MVFVGWGQRFRFPKQIDLCFLDLSLLWFRSRIRDGGVSLSSGVAADMCSVPLSFSLVARRFSSVTSVGVLMVQLCSVGVVVYGEQIKSNTLEKIHVFGCLFLPVLEFFSWPLNKCLFRHCGSDWYRELKVQVVLCNCEGHGITFSLSWAVFGKIFG
ncbi:hypothetical protein F2Q69_00049723 [Brassica cretica]|uniref:Uncharacterized protein n=1 Tax=Brassica cretica TaxID=69181 RepID=A0A8S9PJ00_BRACR|nr:hypothetical protein F2Q69_00049723 [Brassica cretica]